MLQASLFCSKFAQQRLVTRQSSSLPPFLIPLFHRRRMSQRMKRRRPTSPFHSPPCPSAGRGSGLFVFSRLHRLTVVSLHILINNNDDCYCRAPLLPPETGGHLHVDHLRKSWPGAGRRVYKPNWPLLHLFLHHSSRALTHSRQWQ